MRASSCGTSLVYSSSLLLESSDKEPDENNGTVIKWLEHLAFYIMQYNTI